MRLPPPDPLSIGLIYIAALFMAVKEGIAKVPSITAAFPALTLEGWWNFLPLALLLLAGTRWLLAPPVAPAKVRSSDTPVPVKVATEPEPHVTNALVVAVDQLAAKFVREPPSQHEHPAEPEEKIPVPPGTTPERIMALFKGKTEVQGQLLCAAYVGKWMTIRGKVADVDAPYAGTTSLRMNGTGWNGIYNAYASFSLKGVDGERAQGLHTGDVVTLTAKIKNVSGWAVRFDDAKFADASAAAIPFPTPPSRRRKATAVGS